MTRTSRAATTGKRPLLFRGVPASVRALIPLDVSDAVPGRVELPQLGIPAIETWAVPAGAGGLAAIDIAIPAQTPPGRYETVVYLGDDVHNGATEVEPSPLSRIEPSFYRGPAEPGSALTIEFDVLNVGNVAVEVPAEARFVLADSEVVDRLLQVLADAPPDVGKRLAEQLGTEYYEASQAGWVDVSVESGSGRIEPGQAATATAKFSIPAGLSTGRSYTGKWRFAGSAFAIRIESQPASSSDPSRQKVRKRR